MKNTIYLLAILAILGASCSKKNEVLPQKQTYDVSFSVSAMLSADDLTASIGKQASSSVSGTPNWWGGSYIYIYDSNGDLVTHKVLCCSLNEPAMVIGLEKGTYTAVAVGHVLEVLDAEKLSTARSLNQVNADYYNDRVQFKVDGIETDLVKLQLKRKTGMLIIDITDKPSNDVFFVRALVHNLPSEYFFDPFVARGNGHTAHFTSTHDDPLGGFAGYFLVPGDSKAYKTKVTLEVVGHDWEVMKTVVMNDVTIGTNMKTTLTGKLYHASAQDFTVELDDSWAGDDVIDF